MEFIDQKCVWAHLQIYYDAICRKTKTLCQLIGSFKATIRWLEENISNGAKVVYQHKPIHIKQQERGMKTSSDRSAQHTTTIEIITNSRGTHFRRGFMFCISSAPKVFPPLPTTMAHTDSFRALGYLVRITDGERRRRGRGI